MFRSLTKAVEKRISTKTRTSLKTKLDFAGIDEAPESWLASRIVTTILISLIVALIPLVWWMYHYYYFLPTFDITLAAALSIGSFIAVALMLAIFHYFSLYYAIGSRRAQCHAILPDCLSVVAMNIAAGMEPLSALYVSMRPDFAPISDELKRIRSLALGRKSVIEQLSLLTKRIDSESLRNVVAIIERTYLSGGNLAQILESTAYEFREANKLQKELYTATKGYVYFIGFLVLIGVPLLLGVASIFISMTTTQAGGFLSAIAATPSEFAVIPTPLPRAACNIDAIFLSLIAFSAFSAALMLGVLWQGEIRYGVGYIPILLGISVFSFFFLRDAVQTLLKSFGIF